MICIHPSILEVFIFVITILHLTFLSLFSFSDFVEKDIQTSITVFCYKYLMSNKILKKLQVPTYIQYCAEFLSLKKVNIWYDQLSSLVQPELFQALLSFVVISLSSQWFCRLIEGRSKLFVGCWLPFVQFCSS